jgi:hypothetical protein
VRQLMRDSGLIGTLCSDVFAGRQDLGRPDWHWLSCLLSSSVWMLCARFSGSASVVEVAERVEVDRATSHRWIGRYLVDSV